MPLDPRLEAVRAGLPDHVDRTLTPDARRQVTAARRQGNAGLYATDAAQDLDVDELIVPTSAGSARARRYRPPGVPKLGPAFVSIHGGGFWQGGLDDSDDVHRRRAAGGRCTVVAITYRLAPEHPFPAGLDDCFDALHWIVAHAAELGIDRDRIALGGSSAGGNLAAAAGLRWHAAGRPALSGLLLEMPAVDLADRQSASMVDYGEGYGFTAADLDEVVDFYLRGHDPRDPSASPVHADLNDLANFPSTLITSMECDPFRDSAERFAARLLEAGVPVVARRFLGMGHGCAELDRIVPDVAAAYASLVNGFLRHTLRAHAPKCRAN